MGKEEVKLAVFECDRLQGQTLQAPTGDELRGGAYTQLLQTAFRHVVANAPKILHPQITVPPTISFVGFDVQGGEYPEDIADYDGVLITGSLSGVYQEDAWIQRLLNEIRDLDRKKVKTVGISFGHQAIGQALGGQVARNPKVVFIPAIIPCLLSMCVDVMISHGSEVSVRKALVTKDGQQVFLPILKEFRLHYHHNDAILKLPPDFLVLASNNVTEFQSIYKQQQFLTFCGHPEFSHNVEVLAKLLEYDREKLLVPEQLVEHAFTTLSQPTDYEWVLKQILLFYMGFFDKSPRPPGRPFHG